MNAEELYNQVAGITYAQPGIQDEFEEGRPCWELYSRVSDARLRLAERTGIDFEDRDLLEIIEGLEEIGKLLALRMYQYGQEQVEL